MRHKRENESIPQMFCKIPIFSSIMTVFLVFDYYHLRPLWRTVSPKSFHRSVFHNNYFCYYVLSDGSVFCALRAAAAKPK